MKSGFIVLWLGLSACRGGDAERPPVDPQGGARGFFASAAESANREAPQDLVAGDAAMRGGAAEAGLAVNSLGLDSTGDSGGSGSTGGSGGSGSTGDSGGSGFVGGSDRSGLAGDSGGSVGAADPSERALDYDADLWTEVQAKEASIVLDIRYASADNFVGEALYPCARCFLRPEAAARVLLAHRALQSAGYGGLKLFDCYRPTPVQARLWEISPDPRAVAPPSKGSMHNRGLAIDLTVIDREGRELDMGTAYDAFSERSYHSFRDLPTEVRANRKMLRKTMAAAGFRPLRTEWWHYTLKGASRPLADFVWSCE